jgi:hypothetical protein
VSVELLAVPAIALIAIVLMVLSGRARADRPDDRLGGRAAARVVAIDDDGLRLDDSVVSWSSIYEVVVVTRRTIRGVWFGLEVGTDDDGIVLVDGADGLVEAFLGESHRLDGFDHATTTAALGSMSGRAVCFRR